MFVPGTTYGGSWDGWYGPSGRTSQEYNVTEVLESRAGKALQAIGHPICVDVNHLRTQAEVNCTGKADGSLCKPLKSSCLFNVKEDPCEYNNLASKFPVILKRLEEALTQYNKTAVKPNNKPWDPKANPKYWDHTWTTFDDNIIGENDVFSTERS